jgi:hypothetical protein
VNFPSPSKFAAYLTTVFDAEVRCGLPSVISNFMKTGKAMENAIDPGIAPQS